jgi:hypothetical protein
LDLSQLLAASTRIAAAAIEIKKSNLYDILPALLVYIKGKGVLLRVSEGQGEAIFKAPGNKYKPGRRDLPARFPRSRSIFSC